jgi:hypothetical protein
VKDLCFALTIINGGIFIIELATYNDGLYIYSKICLKLRLMYIFKVDLKIDSIYLLRQKIFGI